MARLNAALGASGRTRQVLVATANTPVADGRSHDLTLVMGLEGSDESLRAADSAVRAELANLGTSYQVLYGTTDERLSQALRLIQDWLVPQGDKRPTPQQREICKSTWVWACDKCSDPGCEHRLLTELIATRPAQAIEP